jgi:ferredoxin
MPGMTGMEESAMALRIVPGCVGCWACELVCPEGAVRAGAPHFVIDPRRCTECAGRHADPQCASICPVEGAIVDAAGMPLNPPGSLTGIPPQRLADASAAGVGGGGPC